MNILNIFVGFLNVVLSQTSLMMNLCAFVPLTSLSFCLIVFLFCFTDSLNAKKNGPLKQMTNETGLLNRSLVQDNQTEFINSTALSKSTTSDTPNPTIEGSNKSPDPSHPSSGKLGKSADKVTSLKTPPPRPPPPRFPKPKSRPKALKSPPPRPPPPILKLKRPDASSVVSSNHKPLMRLPEKTGKKSTDKSGLENVKTSHIAKEKTECPPKSSKG